MVSWQVCNPGLAILFFMAHRSPPTALVVDDEPLLAELTAEFLEELGFAVQFHVSPTDALSWVARQKNIDIMVTDIRMPEIDGFTLAKAARAIHEDLPIIYVSGYASGLFGAEVLLPDRSVFIKKPYSLRDMRSAVAALYSGSIKAHPTL